MKLTDQLDRLGHAVRALETAGCRVFEARASRHALPLVVLYSGTTCPPELIVGQPLVETYGTQRHTTVETKLDVCVTWCEAVTP